MGWKEDLARERRQAEKDHRNVIRCVVEAYQAVGQMPPTSADIDGAFMVFLEEVSVAYRIPMEEFEDALDNPAKWLR